MVVVELLNVRVETVGVPPTENLISRIWVDRVAPANPQSSLAGIGWNIEQPA